MLTKDQLTAKRIDFLLMHIQLIARGKHGISPQTIAERALKDDARIVACINGEHQFIDLTSYSQTLFRCGPCGYEVPSLPEVGMRR